MTTKGQYKIRWQQLESEIEAVKKENVEEYAKLPDIPHDSKEWKDRFGKYVKDISVPNKEKIISLELEAEQCRIRSLDKFYCNRHLHSDIQPYEVIEVLSDTRLRLRSMNYVQTNDSVERLRKTFEPGGFLGHFDNSVQEWICTPDENGTVVEVRRRKDRCFYETNGSIPYVLSDKPRMFRDFNF